LQKISGWLVLLRPLRVPVHSTIFFAGRQGTHAKGQGWNQSATAGRPEKSNGARNGGCGRVREGEVRCRGGVCGGIDRR